MKNKEIVKRLKDSLEYEFDLSFNERKELLSYIEQLEKENKILRENAEHNDKVVDKVNWENQQLKKQKNDVVEYIKTTTYSDITGLEKHNITEFWFIKDLLRMLGERDE